MNNNIAIILTQEELDLRMETVALNAVKKALGNEANQRQAQKKIKVGINDGLIFLNSIGFKCSKSLLYKMTMSSTIPFEKFQKTIVFDTDDLKKWVETRKEKRVDIAGNVSRSATAKINVR